jgi:hypothetical protein
MDACRVDFPGGLQYTEGEVVYITCLNIYIYTHTCIFIYIYICVCVGIFSILCLKTEQHIKQLKSNIHSIRWCSKYCRTVCSRRWPVSDASQSPSKTNQLLYHFLVKKWTKVSMTMKYSPSLLTTGTLLSLLLFFKVLLWLDQN